MITELHVKNTDLTALNTRLHAALVRVGEDICRVEYKASHGGWCPRDFKPERYLAEIAIDHKVKHLLGFLEQEHYIGVGEET